jgi:anti-sigma regulatory factor (Ser/Thr protein kinase)
VVAELSLRLTANQGAPAEARRALRYLHGDIPVELMQVVLLLTSELVANSVSHAGTRMVAVHYEAVPQRVRVEVTDDGSGFVPAPRAPDRVSPGGWGLHLVDELSSRWGVVDGGRAQVWFEIDR